MREWVEAQSESGLYSNNSDYVRDLIRKDQLRAKKSTKPDLTGRLCVSELRC